METRRVPPPIWRSLQTTPRREQKDGDFEIGRFLLRARLETVSPHIFLFSGPLFRPPNSFAFYARIVASMSARSASSIENSRKASFGGSGLQWFTGRGFGENTCFTNPLAHHMQMDLKKAGYA
jgi:hypothetical protein